MAASTEQLHDPTIVEQLMHPDGVDPAQLEGQLGPDGQPLTAETSPYTAEGTSPAETAAPARPEAAQHLARVALENAEREALNRTDAADIATAFDEARHDPEVEEARHKLEELFTPGSQADIEEQAAKDAIGTSNFTEVQQAEEVAREVAAGASPLKVVEHEVSGEVKDSREAAEQRAAVDNRYGEERGLRLVAPIVEQIREDLGEVGIKDRKSVVRDQVIEENGTGIGSTKRRLHAVAEQEGGALVKAFAGSKRFQRQQAIDRFGDNLNVLGNAVASQRRGANISARTYRKVGEAYMEGRHAA